MRLNCAIFLDRDNTINEDRGYTHKIEDWRFLPGALAGLALFKKLGWLLIVVSNQSGIGRGYYGEDALLLLERYVSNLLQGIAPIAGWYHCPHLPEEHCNCRKPAPGLLYLAAEDWNVDLSSSWMLGDRLSDVRAGLDAGCKAGLIYGRSPKPDLREWPGVRAWPTLLAAATAIGAPRSAMA